MTRHLALALSLVALLGHAGVALAAEVRGRVLTPEGVAVRGYPVIVTGGGTSQVALTDEQGAFRFEALADGDYEAAPATRQDAPVTFSVRSQGAVDLGTMTVPVTPP